jgi:CelD/BcsL family acetyltransferase involved in cellulose biosynthesis
MTQLFDAAIPDGLRPAMSRTRGSALSVSVVEDFSSLRAIWDLMIADGCASAYQSFGFQSAWAKQSQDVDGSRCVAVVLRDAGGTVGTILPLCIQQMGPLSVGRMLGGKHVNFNMPIAQPGFLPSDRSELMRLMREIGHAVGADVLAFANQPNQWNGRTHAFAPLGGQPSPSFAYKLSLHADCESIIKSRMSNEAQHKLRRKLNRLTEMGTLSHFSATTAMEADRILEAFFIQKSARMLAMGLVDPFAEPGIKAFLRQACTEGLADGQQAIRLFGLRLDDRLIATYGAAVDDTRFSGMFTSFDGSEDVFRWSPGEHMLLWLIQEHCRLGLGCFDLGIGEARYKAQFCDEEEPLFDLHLPVTIKGRLLTTVMRTGASAKRQLKQSPRFMAMLSAKRKRTASTGG